MAKISMVPSEVVFLHPQIRKEYLTEDSDESAEVPVTQGAADFEHPVNRDFQDYQDPADFEVPINQGPSDFEHPVTPGQYGGRGGYVPY